MLQRDKYLAQIYELVKIQSRDLTIDELSDELGISRRYTDDILESCRDDAEERGWIIGAVPYKGAVTIWDGAESSPDQRDRKERSMETAKKRCRRSIHMNYHQIKHLVTELGSNHPEYPYWKTQLLYAEVMRDAAERLD